MIILHANEKIENVVPFPSKGFEWKQIPPHEITAMAERKEHLPLSQYVMKLCQDGQGKHWKYCIGEQAEAGVPYILLTKI
jgi:hypothetical protein